MKFDKTKLIYIFPAIVILTIVSCLIIFSISGNRSFYRYSGQIKQYAERNNLDPAFVAALMQAESGFDKNAISDKGASGLMQLMPETAEYIAGRIGYDKKINLRSAECNICLGTAYLAYLYDKFDNETVVLCAYNAGEGRVVGWLKDSACSIDGINLLYIPFSETRKYVERVRKYKLKYERVYKAN